MHTDDFRTNREHDHQQVGQRLVVRTEDGEVLKDVQTRDNFPIPSVGDELSLTSRELMIDDSEDVAFGDETVGVDGAKMIYSVERVHHEYAFVEPVDELSEHYDSGFTLAVTVEVSEARPL